MKRFFKTLTFLVASLLLLVTGVDHALDQLTTQPSQGFFFACDEKGDLVYSFQGDLPLYQRIIRPWHTPVAHPGIVPRA